MEVVARIGAIFACTILWLASASAQTPPSAFEFFSAPTYSQTVLSPSGSFIAMVHATTEKKCVNSTGQVSAYTTKCGERNARYRANYQIVIYDVNASATVSVLPMPEDIYVQWLEWANDDRLLAAIARRTTTNLRGTKATIGGSRIISIPNGQGEFITLFEDSRAKSRANFDISTVTNLLRSDPDHVIVPAYMGNDLDLWKVNIQDGKYERIATGNLGTFRWFTNRDGKPIFRFDSNLYGTKISVYAWSDEKNNWEHFKTFKLKNLNDEEGFDFEPVTDAEKPGQIYVVSHEENDARRAIKIFDIKSKEYVETVFEHDVYDVGGALLDVKTGEYAGAWYIADRLEQVFLDSRAQAHFRGLNAFFDNKENVRFLGFDSAGDKAVVYVSSPNNPGAYYIYDIKNARVAPIMTRREQLSKTQFGRAEILNINTRDGKSITGYLTLPPNYDAQNPPPLIVMPHGGPEVRDYYDFDAYSQYFAVRGYQVLQVNFRGSSGYGKDFAEAGYGEWGGLMQNDVTDAVLSLQQSGRAKPEQTCIVGFSYGAYVALYGAAATPDLYKCAAGISGASDLVASLSESKRQYGGDSETYDYWLKSIGDPKADEVTLTQKSPINLVEQIRAPVLLIHGEDDTIENVKQSQRMHKALTDAGRDVEYLELEFEGHRGWSLETQILVVETIERFLAENL